MRKVTYNISSVQLTRRNNQDNRATRSKVSKQADSLQRKKTDQNESQIYTCKVSLLSSPSLSFVKIEHRSSSSIVWRRVSPAEIPSQSGSDCSVLCLHKIKKQPLPLCCLSKTLQIKSLSSSAGWHQGRAAMQSSFGRSCSSESRYRPHHCM